MINSLRTDLAQGIFSIRFFISCTILLGLFGLATGVPTNDNFGVESGTIIQMFLTTDKSLWLKDPCFSSYQIWQNGLRVLNLGTFLPAIVSFPILPLLADELKSQNYRFHCIRGKYKTYVISKCFAAIIIACYIVFICSFIFWLLCWIVLPSPDSYANTILGEIYGVEIPWGTMLELTVSLMVVAAMNATIGILLTVITVDKFASICLPVVLSFLANQIGQKMYIKQHDARYFSIKPDCFYQADIWISAFRINISSWVVLLIPIILSAIFVFLAYNIAKRKMQQ